MDATWADTFDVVIVGTGAAAFSAAITAGDAGLNVVMLESSTRWGGNSAMSRGGLWLPNNPLMQRARAADSGVEALEYLGETVGDAGPGASLARKEAFINGVGSFVNLAESLGMQFARAAQYPDYYPEKPGGKVGRAIEHVPFDVKRIGEWWESSRGSDGVPAPVMTDDFWLLQRAWSTPGGFLRGAKVAFRVLGKAAKREKSVGMGAALMASFMDVALRQGAQVWLNAPAEELVVDGDRVVGVRTKRGDREVLVKAERGVVLAGGGFDHNPEWRQRYQGVDGTASSGAESNLGGAIAIGEAVGADIDLMDDAWWGGSVPPATPGGRASFIVSERSMPHCIIVDAAGNRFANESESYVDLGHHMLDHRRKVPGKFWMIADARHSRKYLRSYAMDPKGVRAMAEAGILHKTATLGELAGRLGMDYAQLQQTVEAFNGFCRTGMDHDFGRGQSVYDRYYGDPLVRPNPNLGTLEKGPFTAIEIVPGDLGTKGGLVTDEHARVLREDGSAIEGLYCAGNNSASVMGRTYPGPGATLGPATVFGHLAARHIASS